MIIDAFMQLIMNNLQQIIGGAVLAVISIAAVIAALLVVESGASKLLDFISGGAGSAPGVGYQYEEYVDGKPQYRTWTKKDQYYYDKARR